MPGRDHDSPRAFDEEIGHGPAVLRGLMAPCKNTKHIIFTDSYFSLVETAEALLTLGLRYMGVVKRSTREFLMKELFSMEMRERGDCKSPVHVTNEQNTPMMSLE